MKQNFIYPEIKETDRVFGATLTGKEVNPTGDWRQYLPPTEDQNVRGIESSACYVEAQQHAIATVQEEEFNLPDLNYSARFNALLSGGTEQGGDPIRAAKSIKYDGMIPDAMMPFGGDIQSWDDFHSFKGVDMNECKQKAKEWLDRWKVDYKIVAERDDPVEVKYENLKKALKIGVPSVSVSNYRQRNGRYYKLPNERDIHFVECVYVSDKNEITIRDTYSPYEKVLEANYNFDFSLLEIVEKKTYEEQLSLLSQVLSLIGKWLNLIDIPTNKPIPPLVENPVESVSKLDQWAKAIETYEGANKVWNNPGAIRGKNGQFLKFPTYEAGFNYLKDYLTRAATGLHKAYPKGGETSLLEFQKIYSPASDNNNPEAYCAYVCIRLGVTKDIKIINLV